ncbi:succinate dehydrogenase, hydrophobic membrane anchor protein [Candidatus Finniella inopinata]|nr:succinate dehydrogenase, hydrophobic membrane anchor protein [Candidatus Finniella inopinata]
MKMKPHHQWQLQRLTALFLSIALPFLGVFLLALKRADYNQVVMAVRNPALAAFLGVTIAVSLYHMALELKEIIRDYLRDSAAKVALGLTYSAAVGLMILTLYSLIGIMCR